MEQKNYTEVLIDGTIYTLGGTEGEAYLQRVAAYINEKISTIRQQGGFRKQSQEYQALMVELNIADDYFKEQERADLLAEQKAAMEKDAYSLKHELITTQMRLENDQAELDRLKQERKAAGQTPQGRRLQELEEANAAAAVELQEVKEQAAKELEEAKAAAAKELEEAKAAAAKELEEAEAAAAKELEEAKAAAAKELEEAEAAAAKELEEAKAAAAKELEEAKAAAVELQKVKAQVVKELEEAKEQAAQELEAVIADAAEALEEAQTEVEREQERASVLQQKLDETKRELEQLKAIHAAAAALSTKPPLK